MPSGIYLIIFGCTIHQSLPMNLIKPSHFTETKIYFKIDPKAANTARSDHPKSGYIYSKWNQEKFLR